MRDLLRAREDAKRAQLRGRHQLSKFLLRHERRWPKSNWSREHLEWIAKQRFDHPALFRLAQDDRRAAAPTEQDVLYVVESHPRLLGLRTVAFEAALGQTQSVQREDRQTRKALKALGYAE